MIDTAYKLLQTKPWDLENFGEVSSYPGFSYTYSMITSQLEGTSREALSQKYEEIEGLLNSLEEIGLTDTIRLGFAIEGADPTEVPVLFQYLALFKLAQVVEDGFSGIGMLAIHDAQMALTEVAWRSSPIDETEFRSIWQAGEMNHLRERNSKASKGRWGPRNRLKAEIRSLYVDCKNSYKNPNEFALGIVDRAEAIAKRVGDKGFLDCEIESKIQMIGVWVKK